MKEVSIEDKAKRYDVAISIMEKYLKSGNAGVIAENTILKAFPELKESEDERIRKALIHLINEQDGFLTEIDGINVKDILTWLEMQNRQEDEENGDFTIYYPLKNGKGEYECIPYSFYGTLTSFFEDSDLINFLRNCFYTEEECEEWIEKQGEQKSINNQFTPEQAGVLDKLIDKFLKQKSADKIKPKFHEGDWIVGGITENKPRQIAKVTGKGYKTTYGGWIGFSFEKNLHLWTIQDAKDGDVLYYKSSDIEYIVMNKGVNEHGNIDSYFRYNSLNGFGVDIPSVFSRQDDITPASKEQRDLLFQKMKEAGYEWDAEKKELKKIEQKPTGKVENKSDFELSLKHIMEEAIECGDTHNLKADAELLYNIAQKPAKWSEEDELTRNALINLVEMYYGSCIGQSEKDRLLFWLRFLKPQPKQEWSEEDEKIYNRIYDLIHAAAYANYEVDEDGTELGEYAKITNWFKSIKERITWRPTKKQLMELENVFSPDTDSWDEDILRELHEQLKKL